MSDSDESQPSSLAGQSGSAVMKRSSGLSSISFNRQELSEILNVYGRKVSEGEWRDYAIDLLKDRAVFSVFRRSSEVPLFRIEKNPKLARRQGVYSVVAPGGMVLKRGHELKTVLRVLEKKRHLRLVSA
ncbi:MAG: DUF2794 domain-containing protein [Stappiaceae bacterium]